MITIKSQREIEGMAKSGAILANVHKGLRKIIKPGISTWEIEKFARNISKVMMQFHHKLVLMAINTQLVYVLMMKLLMLSHAVILF